MQQYIYQTPQIMNDAIFLLHGGQTGTSTPAQREVAYAIAEEQMVEYLHSYLTPTTVTGTFFWKGKNPLVLDYGWVQDVHQVIIHSRDFRNGCSMETATGCHIVGYPPYNIQVAYTSGLQTGTYTSPKFLQALTLVSQIQLNEIDVSLSNESIADVGLEFFINQRYHEKRTKGITTTFGNSPVAQRAARLVRSLRARPGGAIW